MLKRRTAIVLSVAFSIWSGIATAADWQCAVDLNGDGCACDANESSQCAATDIGSQMCPIGMQDCLPKYEQPVITSVPAKYDPLYGPTCPGGGTYNPNTDMCDSEPVCSSGTLTADKTQCFFGNIICPSGNYACEPVGGVNKCSPNVCSDLTSVPPDTTTPAYPAYTDNGTVESDGSCSGIILLFNGRGGECRPPGVETAYRDCCDYGGGDPGWFNFCKETEATVVNARNAGQTHFLEEYCKTRWKFGVGSVCVQRARSYCVFNSKLGRIIQEQGRAQLQAFQPNGAWGDHNAPNCKGLSPQEFQMIDFSKVDLSEFVSSINATVSTQVQQQMNNSVNQFFNNMQQ